MKAKLLNYYAFIMMIFFIIYNLIFKNLIIGGLIYQIFMIKLIIINIITLVVFRKNIKFKGLIIIVYFFIWLSSKNSLQCIFCLSSMITLMCTGFIENKFIELITIIITIFFMLFSMPLLFIYLSVFGTGLSEEREKNDIYEDMHYYCNNNYEVYSYSAGAMDRFHYSIGRHYEIINIDDIIYISYNERNEVSQKKYESYLKNHKCSLVGDINGFK